MELNKIVDLFIIIALGVMSLAIIAFVVLLYITELPKKYNKPKI